MTPGQASRGQYSQTRSSPDSCKVIVSASRGTRDAGDSLGGVIFQHLGQWAIRSQGRGVGDGYSRACTNKQNAVGVSMCLFS